MDESALRLAAWVQGYVVVKVHRGPRRRGIYRVIDPMSGALHAYGTFEDIADLIARVEDLPNRSEQGR